MAKNGGSGRELKGQLDDEIDDLFKLPLAEFTGARNTLAARLKKGGQPNDAERVKLLAKPSISAWAVNQLYWMHRDVFDELLATGKHFRRGPRPTGKVADMRESLDARREVLLHLSDLAATLLRDAGHNPTLDTMRHITTTLEAMSAYAMLPDGPTPGHLTHDVDPPSFELLASLMSGTGTIERTERITPLRKSASASQQKTVDMRRLEETRQAKIAAAKVSLQEAKRALVDARAQVQNVEAEQKKANADVKEAEKYRREAEERLEQATAASEDATRRAQVVATEATETAKALENAKRTVENATKELESLFQQAPAK